MVATFTTVIATKLISKMTIENAIQQKTPFRNEWQRVAVNLIYTSNWLTEQFKAYLKPFDITLQQYNVLRILRGAGKPLSTSDIRERLLDKMSDTSRIVERLCQKGLVARSVCPNDKRLVDVTLTPEGYSFLGKLDELDSGLDVALQNLSAEEARQLSDLLDKMRG